MSAIEFSFKHYGFANTLQKVFGIPGMLGKMPGILDRMLVTVIESKSLADPMASIAHRTC